MQLRVRTRLSFLKIQQSSLILQFAVLYTTPYSVVKRYQHFGGPAASIFKRRLLEVGHNLLYHARTDRGLVHTIYILIPCQTCKM
jgi:hypothetical protein